MYNLNEEFKVLQKKYIKEFLEQNTDIMFKVVKYEITRQTYVAGSKRSDRNTTKIIDKIDKPKILAKSFENAWEAISDNVLDSKGKFYFYIKNNDNFQGTFKEIDWKISYGDNGRASEVQLIQLEGSLSLTKSINGERIKGTPGKDAEIEYIFIVVLECKTKNGENPEAKIRQDLNIR